MTRPRPVVNAASIAGLIHSAAVVLTFLGYDEASAHLDAMTTTIVAVALGAFTVGAHLLAALHAQARVTPLADPKTVAGVPLVPADLTPAVLHADATVVEPMAPDAHGAD